MQARAQKPDRKLVGIWIFALFNFFAMIALGMILLRFLGMHLELINDLQDQIDRLQRPSTRAPLRSARL